MEALLAKNDAWGYVSGEYIKPELIASDITSATAVLNWTKNDSKAKSNIILAISPSELKQIKGCASSTDVWLKLESIYQSKEPSRKATLLKQLTLQRMEESGDVREHINRFFDAVDKLCEMAVEINPHLLAIMLLYSLPASFENFRCAIESRNELPTPDVLRVKFIEYNARKSEVRQISQNSQNALYTKNNAKWRRKNVKKTENTGNTASSSSVGRKNKETFKFRCHKCR